MRQHTRASQGALSLILAISLAVSACGGDDDSAGPGGQPDGGAVSGDLGSDDLGGAPDLGPAPQDLGPEPEDLAAGDLATGDLAAADLGTPDLGPEEGCTAALDTVLRLHYQNASLAAEYEQLYLWTWGAWSPEKDVPACGTDDFGAIFDLPREWFEPGASMGFKPKRGPGTAGPWYEFDRAWTEGSSPWEGWVVAEDVEVYPSPEAAAMPRIDAVYWDSSTELELELSRAVPGMDELARYRLEPDAQVLEVQVNGTKATLRTSELSIQGGYTLFFDTGEGTIQNGLYPRHVMDAYVTDLPLGSFIDEQGDTGFRVFAPRATEIVLHVAETAAGAETATYPLERDPVTGTWSHTLSGNRHGLYYWYTVDGPQAEGEHFDPSVPLNDPYSFIALSSYGGVAGRSMVFDPARLGEASAVERVPVSGLVAYELHVRDLTGHASSGMAAEEPGFRGYLGLARAGLRGPEFEGQPVSTGLDHLAELGVNAVQLLPVHEFPADPTRFNWGYFTANFFAPEGMYATNAEDGSAALELKAAIDALHGRGLAVILDVVFNHSAEGSAFSPALNFKGFDSKYYYRQDPGSFTYRAGSGVGNEMATERPMVRRMVIDSLRHWVERYGVDGFRFDLAGLIDLDTVRAIGAAFPDVYLYGEPWAASGALWGKGAVNAIEPWAVFNDEFRDTAKGSPEGQDGGFIQGRGQRGRMKSGIGGNALRGVGSGSAWAAAPADSLLYLDAHDNLTLADKLEYSLAGLQVEEKRARVRLAAALTLTSLGPVMLHAGVEMLRTKPYVDEGDGRPLQDPDSPQIFDANSYSSPDSTNNLDWGLKVEHMEVVRFFQAMLALRASDLGQPARPEGAPAASYIAWHEPADNERALGYTLNADGSQGPRRLRVLLNPNGVASATFAVDFPEDEGWRWISDGLSVDAEGLGELPAEGEVVLEGLGIRIYAADAAPAAGE